MIPVACNLSVHCFDPQQCPGKFLGIIGRYPSVSNPTGNMLTSFGFRLGYILEIPFKMIGNFPELQPVISQTQPVHL